MWNPPYDWPYVVSHMRPELREAYTTRCENWHKNHPPRPEASPSIKIPQMLDARLFEETSRKYGAIIPIPELFKIGYTKEQVQKVLARRKWYREHDADLTKDIDKRWPGGKIKPKKIVKAVNKKTPAGIENI
jgi:hypothetical protein